MIGPLSVVEKSVEILNSELKKREIPVIAVLEYPYIRLIGTTYNKEELNSLTELIVGLNLN